MVLLTGDLALGQDASSGESLDTKIRHERQTPSRGFIPSPRFNFFNNIRPNTIFQQFGRNALPQQQSLRRGQLQQLQQIQNNQQSLLRQQQQVTQNQIRRQQQIQRQSGNVFRPSQQISAQRPQIQRAQPQRTQGLTEQRLFQIIQQVRLVEKSFII